MFSAAATHAVSVPRPVPRGGLGHPRRATTATVSLSRQSRRVTTAAASPDTDDVFPNSPSSSAAGDNLAVLLPPGYSHDASSNRIADLSGGTAAFGVAMPNLRPLKEAKNDWLMAMKVGSAVLLGSTVGAIVVHNVQLASQKKEAGIDAVADSIDLGYGFGYGYEYGYAYGRGASLTAPLSRERGWQSRHVFLLFSKHSTSPPRAKTKPENRPRSTNCWIYFQAARKKQNKINMNAAYRCSLELWYCIFFLHELTVAPFCKQGARHDDAARESSDHHASADAPRGKGSNGRASGIG